MLYSYLSKKPKVVYITHSNFWTWICILYGGSGGIFKMYFGEGKWVYWGDIVFSILYEKNMF